MTRKLIEVALPLEAINAESAREKSIRTGHPSTIHLWWARRPLAACRAVLFASLVDDPSEHPEQFPTEELQAAERQRLFALIERLVRWENVLKGRVIEEAKVEIQRSTGGGPVPMTDPFCGGGSLPLEAQRLGLDVHAGDINPVAVLISRALTEVPALFPGQPPVYPGAHPETQWENARGLATDVELYGAELRTRMAATLEAVYPRAPDGTPVIAWLWTRTVRCPNPACGAAAPLVRSFTLSNKRGKRVWIEPRVDRVSRTYRFDVLSGAGDAPEGTVTRTGARCLVCETSIPFEHIRNEGKCDKLGQRMLAIVAQARRGRTYLPPDAEHEKAALSVVPDEQWVPDTDLPEQALGFRVQAYGLTRHHELFTARQLQTLGTMARLIEELHAEVADAAARAGLSEDGKSAENGGTGARAYADAICMYLALAMDRVAMTANTLVRWNPVGEKAQHAFGRQALSMTWDFADPNVFGTATGSIQAAVRLIVEPLAQLPAFPPARITQVDAAADLDAPSSFLVSTDPPYYDNIGYADLADFFYVWLRLALKHSCPDLFSTLLTPKGAEMIADPGRFAGDRAAARDHFEHGLSQAFNQMHGRQDHRFPMSVFYAFKQSEEDGNGAGVVSTGWETMLEGLIRAGFQITGTWPIRTEMASRMRGQASNALASSIVLVCRVRPTSAALGTTKEFVDTLRARMPIALRQLQEGNIAPVDLAQAAIGPGMSIFSSYSRVVEAEGSAMSVRSALGLINQALDEQLAHQDADFDPETRWALSWFEQFGMSEGPFGVAETLCTARNVALNGLLQAGIVVAPAGRVRLLDRPELDETWDPTTDTHLTVWEVVQHLIRLLDQGGEVVAGQVLARLGGLGDVAKELAYRLYLVCERKGWATDAFAYNALVTSWPELARLSAMSPEAQQQAMEL